MPPNPNTKSLNVWFNSVLYHADCCFSFGKFIIKEEILPETLGIMHHTSFIKKLHMQLNLVKVRGPTLMAYQDYFQMRMPHVARAHEKMQCLLHAHNVNTQASNEDFSFCFEGDFKFTCNKEELTEFAPHIFVIISLTKITILWNSIPDDIKLATSLDSFKSKLKS